MEKTFSSSGSLVPSRPAELEGYDQGAYAEVVENTRHLSPSKQAEEIREYIAWCEEQMLALPLDESTKITHSLLDGLYARTMYVPAGVSITGARHLKSGLVLLQQGTISILSERGAAKLTAPLVFPSPAGSGRLGYAHSDVVWTNVFATTGTTLDEIERELFSLEF